MSEEIFMLKKFRNQKLLVLCALVFIGLVLGSAAWAQASSKPVILTGVVGQYFSINNLTFQVGGDLYRLTGKIAGLEKYIGRQVEIVGVIDGSTGTVCPPKGIMAPCRLLPNLIVMSYKVL
jgi:hypothetical protein